MIDQYPSANGVLTSLIWRKTAAGGETSLSGYDDASQALSYTPGQEQVYLNGILLVRGDDYTATNGTSITGLTALAANDFVQINCYNNFSVASVPSTSITGTIANNQLANSTITINGSSTALGGTYTNASASTSSAGIVQLTDSTSSTSTTTAATPNAVKSAYDLANAAIPKSLTTTTGDIIYASSANTPSRLGLGSAGQYLKVNSGATAPEWATLSAGGMTLISETTASAVTSITFSSISQSYKQLILIWSGVYHSASGSEFSLRLNNNSSTVYENAGLWKNVGGTSVSSGGYTQLGVTNAGSAILPFGKNANYAAYSTDYRGYIIIDNYASTTKWKEITVKYVGYNSVDDVYEYANFESTFTSTSAVTSLDIVRLSGSATLSNRADATIRLYGVS